MQEMIGQMSGKWGTQYNFPAPYSMQVRAPMDAVQYNCTLTNACSTTPDPIPDLNCVLCEYLYPANTVPCGAKCYDCNYCTHQDFRGLTATKSLRVYEFNPTFKPLQVFTGFPCTMICSNTEGYVSGCGSAQTAVLYQAATGNIAWGAYPHTITNLGNGTPNTAVTQQWDKFYAINSTYVPNDDCKWIMGINSNFRQPPIIAGYKNQQVQTYQGVTGNCGAFNMIINQTLGWEYKSTCTQVGCTSCEQPCIAIFLRVEISGTLNKNIGSAGPTHQGGIAYGCSCIPPGIATCTSGVQGGFFGAVGGIGKYQCGGFDPVDRSAQVRTDAYYRSYWNGTDTLKEFLEKPLSLYKISSTNLDGQACGSPGDLQSLVRSYNVVTKKVAADCVQPIGMTTSKCASTLGTPPPNCNFAPLYNQVPTPPVPPGQCSCYRGTQCGPWPSAVKYVFGTAGGAILACTNSCVAPNTCPDCNGNTPDVGPFCSYTNNSLCQVCETACIEYADCKTKPGGQSFTNADVESMPCDWENIPLQITPVYNPLLPDITFVKSLDFCGVSVNGTGTLAGGTLITITGPNLLYASSVTIDNIPCTNVIWKNSITVTAITPASATTGAKFVRVITPGGTSIPSATDIFTYTNNAGPAVCSVSPLGGPTAGGTFLTLIGQNFTGATSVTIGGIVCASLTVLHSGAITCYSPAASPSGYIGSRPIKVFTPFGSSSGSTQWYYS